ncbi:MAG: hypothetical protein MRJ96_17030 [Nitrospirales bacterium]|nr:hypothetical protein [Nitrospira sp.]MDR4503150.1 hypothetical protein [Nitrospirales bacterium]
MNATLKKFGDPETRIKAFERWVVLLRPQQVTLGALVIVSTEQALSFSKLSPEAYIELRQVTQFVETQLSHAFAYEKINYLMLMMVDPDVHFHVFPRYSSPQTFDGHQFTDHGWPGPPDLKQVNVTTSELNSHILSKLKE